MESYKVVIKKSARDELSRIPKKELSRILGKIRSLSDDPRPPGNMKLSFRERYRIRQGDYRIVYLIDDDARFVDIYRIGHRREVYRKVAP
jgi:mRNA interferase RelE/StbE